jgi:hypothetical protein
MARKVDGFIVMVYYFFHIMSDNTAVSFEVLYHEGGFSGMQLKIR